MTKLTDDLFLASVSRRKFIERATASGLALAVLGDAPDDVDAHQARQESVAKDRSRLLRGLSPSMQNLTPSKSTLQGAQ